MRKAFACYDVIIMVTGRAFGLCRWFGGSAIEYQWYSTWVSSFVDLNMYLTQQGRSKMTANMQTTFSNLSQVYYYGANWQ